MAGGEEPPKIEVDITEYVLQPQPVSPVPLEPMLPPETKTLVLKRENAGGHSLPFNISRKQAAHRPPPHTSDSGRSRRPSQDRFRIVLHRFRTVSHHFRTVSDCSESFSDRFERRTLRKVRENSRKLAKNSRKLRQKFREKLLTPPVSIPHFRVPP